MSEGIRHEMSDGFINVPEGFRPARPNQVQNQDQCFQESVAETMVLENLNQQWLNTCVSELNKLIYDFDNLSVHNKRKHIFDHFLFSDMRLSVAGGVLTDNFQTLNQTDLPGPFVLQVDDIMNLSSHPQCHRLMMTDGVGSVFGMEKSPIKALKDLAPGSKVRIRNLKICNGLVMLVPEGFEVLGGMVEHLKAKSNVVDAIVSMSEMDISEENFADNSYRLTGDKEIPLKFLDTVLSDWRFRQNDTPMQSKIKCIVTGIGGFHYENRTEYEFLVKVNDGSLGTKVRIDPKIVEAQIGYSPKQLSDALSYPGKDVADKVNKKAEEVVDYMFEDFDGTMFVEMNKNSAFPVALGWIDDATASDISRFVDACDKIILATSP